MKKAIADLPQLRQKLSSIVDDYLDIQQDILEPSSIAASYGTSANLPSCRTANASPV